MCCLREFVSSDCGHTAESENRNKKLFLLYSFFTFIYVLTIELSAFNIHNDKFQQYHLIQHVGASVEA